MYVCDVIYICMPANTDDKRRQIAALEFAYAKAVKENKPQQQLFALMAKIKKEKRLLEDRIRDEWLAR